MKTFLSNATLFVISIFLVCIMLIIWSNKYYDQAYSQHYLASLNEKAICASNSQPQIVLAGGSNVAFGMDSKIFKDSMHLSTCNIGLHGALGLKFAMDQVEGMAQANDQVVFSIGYYVRMHANEKLLYVVRKAYPKAKSWGYKIKFSKRFNFLFADTQKALKTVFQNLGAQSARQGESIYRRDAFNALGDMVGHLNLGALEELKGGNFDFGDENYQVEVNALNAWARRLGSEGVKVYFAFPAITNVEFLKNESKLLKFEQFIRENLEFPVLNDVKEVVYDEREFYDTVYHLSASARMDYSKNVAHALKSLVE